MCACPSVCVRAYLRARVSVSVRGYAIATGGIRWHVHLRQASSAACRCRLCAKPGCLIVCGTPVLVDRRASVPALRAV